MSKNIKLTMDNLKGADFFLDSNRQRSIDMSNPLNKIRSEYVKSLYDSGMDNFIKQLDNITDLKLFAKFSVDIILEEKDQLNLLNFLHDYLSIENKDDSEDNIIKFNLAFFENQIILRSDHRLEISKIPFQLRALYLNVLPFKYCVMRYLDSDNELVKEVEDIYWRQFIFCPTIDLSDLDYILPKLLKVENYKQIEIVLNNTFSNCGIISLENMEVLLFAVSKLVENDYNKSQKYPKLQKMFKYANKAYKADKRLLELEVSLLKIFADSNFNYEFLIISSRVLNDKLEFLDFFEKSLKPHNSKSANHILKLLYSNENKLFRHKRLYLSQEQYISFYNEIDGISKNKHYYNQLQYILALISLNFTLNDNNIPTYELLKLLNREDKKVFLKGYCDNQIFTMFNDIESDLKLHGIDNLAKLTVSNKRLIDDILKNNADIRVSEIEVIIVRADLAGYYNISTALKQTIKKIKDYKVLLTKDYTILKRIQNPTLDLFSD